ncbi:HNH endonuclease [Mycobacterium koreense]|nr:HNH endonuclease [Mycolicibacillus koreensis]
MSRWGQGTGASHAVRRRVLERANHQCEIRDKTCVGTATIADHIIPVARLGVERADANSDSLFQAACKPCHDRKTQREAAEGLRAHHARRRARLRLPQQPHPGE